MPAFSVNNSNNRFTLTLTVTETSYSIADNTSTLSWSLDLKANTSHHFELYAIGLAVILNGVTVKSQSRADWIQYSIAEKGTVNLAKGSGFVVQHNDDGSKSIPVVYSIDMATETFTPGPLSGSGTMPLTTIARYSTLSIPAGGTLGVPQTITVTRPSSQTHTVSWVCGTAKGTLCTNSTATSLSFTPDIALAAQNTAEPSVTITFTINTTGVGDKTYPVSYAIPAGIKPSLSITVEDATGYKNTYGGYVQGWSKLKITGSPTLAYGSPIVSYNITADGKTFTTNPAITDVIARGDKVSITAYATDQRQRPSEPVSTEVNVIPYSPPAATVNAYRCDEDGNRNDEGDHMVISLSIAISSLNNKNTADYVITYSGGANGEIRGSGVSYTSEPIACDAARPCSVEVEVTDDLSSGDASDSIPIAFTLMEFYNTGKGVSFGKVATRDGLDCAMPAYFSGAVEFSGPVSGLAMPASNDAPTATSSTLGLVRPDNSTITISNGVLTAAHQSSITKVVTYAAGTTATSYSFTTSSYSLIFMGLTPSSSGAIITACIPGAVAAGGCDIQVADETNYCKWSLSSSGISRATGSGNIRYIYGVKL